MDIPESYIIHDTRIGKDFKGITICGYKRKDVLNAYQNSMINNKLEDAIRWVVELHSTGLNLQIWESIKNIYFRYIHINNPKLLFYILKRERDYLNIIKTYPKKHEIFTRNNQEIRNLYSELTSICVLTTKSNLFLQKSLPTINNKSFDKEDIHKRMISRDLDKITEYLFNSSSNELKLAFNEIINNIYMKNGTFQNCIYWYLWIEKIEHIRKTVYNDIDEHWIFILWNILIQYSDENIINNNLTFIKKLHKYYKTNFKLSDISKKKYYFFIVFYVLKLDINWNINIFQQEDKIIQTNANINIMYQNIIKNNESELSSNVKDALYKKYNNLFYNQNSKPIKLKKYVSTTLDNDINIILPTKYPEYSFTKVTKPDEIKERPLISKNMTERDIQEYKEEKINKKLEAFSQFIALKKPIIKKPLDNEEILVDKDVLKNINFKR
jgi:hypothetical protein